MKGMEYATLSQAAAAIRSGQASAVKLTELALSRIEALDGRLNAFITVTADLALEQAARADRELADGADRGPLHGIPVAIKDLIDTAGVRTTYGSAYYAEHVPDADAAAVRHLWAAGAVCLGKTGLHEMAFGTTSVNPFFGAIGNPWRPDFHPGGSSGGSAVAVAAGMAYAALGTDTGCSIRQPAQCCGIVGHKPTYGLVSTDGVMPLVSSMDHVGPMTRSVRDAALVLRAIATTDAGDPQRVPRSVDDVVEGIGAPIGGRIIGVSRDYFFEGGDEEVIAIVEAALDVFRQLGATVETVRLPDCHMAYAAANATFSEIIDVHREALQDDPEAFSEPFRTRYEAMRRYTREACRAAQAYRVEFTGGVERVFERVDVLAMPTSTVAAAPIAAQPPDHDKERRKNACIFDFTGQPSVSVPCGFTRQGLPVGLMICGGTGEDAKVLRFAHAFEQATPWHGRHPPTSLLGQ